MISVKGCGGPKQPEVGSKQPSLKIGNSHRSNEFLLRMQTRCVPICGFMFYKLYLVAERSVNCKDA